MRHRYDLFAKLRARLKRNARRMRAQSQSGATAVEFAMIAPVLFLFICGILEVGVIFFAQTTLQNAADDAARQVRTGQLQGNVTAAQLKTLICNEVVGIITNANCTANLQIDMRVASTFTASNYSNVINADGSLNTGAMAIQTSDSCQVVLFRAFYPWTIMTPLMAPLIKNMPNNQFLLSVAEAFRNEPYNDPNVANPTC